MHQIIGKNDSKKIVKIEEATHQKRAEIKHILIFKNEQFLEQKYISKNSKTNGIFRATIMKKFQEKKTKWRSREARKERSFTHLKKSELKRDMGSDWGPYFYDKTRAILARIVALNAI